MSLDLISRESTNTLSDIQNQFLKSFNDSPITGSTGNISLKLDTQTPKHELHNLRKEMLQGVTPILMLLGSIDITVTRNNLFDFFSNNTGHHIKINSLQPFQSTFLHCTPATVAYYALSKKKDSFISDSDRKKVLYDKLQKFIVNKKTVDLTKDKLYSNKIENIFNEISKVSYSDLSIEVTSIKVLNINLLFDKNNIITLSVPLTNNVKGLTDQEVLFSYFEKNKFKFSDAANISEISKKITNFILSK